MAANSQLLHCATTLLLPFSTQYRRYTPTSLFHLPRRSISEQSLLRGNSLKFSLRQNVEHLPRTTAHATTPFSFPNPPHLNSLLNQFDSVAPLSVCKWSLVVSAAIFAAKKTINFFLNPFFWTYASLAWIFYPWIFAIVAACYALYCLRRHAHGRATAFEQLCIVTAAVSWLTVVPAAQANGFLQGWPVVFFFAYHYFFFFESSVRKRLYGDLYPREHDPKWDISLPSSSKIAFFFLVLVGHWLAAFEGPELHLVSGGWANLPIWILIAVVMFMRYHSVLYLARYSEKVAVPQAVVQFGPYRWVRHPIYASTMLLFAVNCVALRAPLSLLFLMAVCVWYYGWKADLEEASLGEAFGERYNEYANKVRYKLIPLVF